MMFSKRMMLLRGVYDGPMPPMLFCVSVDPSKSIWIFPKPMGRQGVGEEGGGGSEGGSAGGE